jgi:hypothetical protein
MIQLMIRRGISTFALLGYLAGQLAMAPHAHAKGKGHQGQCWQPHIHVSKSGGDACDHHGRLPHGHGHDRAYADRALQADEGRRDSRPFEKGLGPDSDHDADAIFVASLEQTAPRSESASLTEVHEALQYDGLVAVMDGHSALLVAGAAAGQLFDRTPAPSCALYVTLRTLRI